MRRFSLLEILVVVAIIGILASISLGVFGGSRRSAQRRATQGIIKRLQVAIDAYANEFGDYPPSSAKAAGLTSNGVNDGIESLARCLTTRRRSGPFIEFKESELTNLDEDKTASDGTRSIMMGAALSELCDSWGNPLVYLHNKDYKRGGKVSLLIDGELKITTVVGARDPKSKGFRDFTKYQLRSVGPDGKDDGGDGDDISNWE